MILTMNNDIFIAELENAPSDGYCFWYEELEYLLQNGDDEFYFERME